MMDGPPNSLESLIACCIPPACREEVLGDLAEKYTSRLQYFFLAVRTIPFVIVSRLRRVNGPAFLLIDPVLVCGAFLLEAWRRNNVSLADPATLFHLAIPAALTWIYLLASDAFSAPGKSAPFARTGLILMVVFMSMAGSETWLYGFFSAWILVSCARALVPFHPNQRRTQFVNTRFSWAATALFVVSWVLLHFSGILFWIGTGVFAVAIGYGLIKRLASK